MNNTTGVRKRSSSQIIHVNNDDTFLPENTAHTCCNT